MIPASTVEKLGKLIPLLASDNDGEVIATARAIARTLEAAGSDFHALSESLTKARVVVAPSSADVTPYNYANFHRRAAAFGGDPDNADAMSPKFGLPIHHPDQVAPWWEVTLHCLDLNKKVAKKHGGRFLREFEIQILENILQGHRWPTNAHAAWIETVVARCHQARDAARGDRGKAP